MRWLTVSISLVFLIGAASAQHTGTSSTLPEPGTTPGSLFFGLEQAQESVSLALTFNKEKKAQKRLQMAEERLAEAEKLSNSNKTKRAEKALQMHSSEMERAENAVQNVPEERRNNVSQELNNTRQKSLKVLQDLKQRLPEAAMKGIETAIQAHKQKMGERPDQTETPGGDNIPDQTGPNSTPETNGSEVTGPQTDKGQTSSEGYKATGRVIRTSS